MRLRPLCLAAFALLAACAAAPEQRQYLLEAQPAANAAATTIAAPAGLEGLGLREIAFPLYARRPQMASRAEDGGIVSSDDFRWAEEPPRAATRLMARIIDNSLEAPVFVEPWPQGAAPNVIVSVEVDRFIGSLGGEVVLEGQVIIARAGGTRELKRFALTEPVTGASHADLARAYGAAIGHLAETVRRAL